MEGTSYEQIETTFKALSGAWVSASGWRLEWHPERRVEHLEVLIFKPGNHGAGIERDITCIPRDVLERYMEVTSAFDRWKDGTDYCFQLPWSLRQAQQAVAHSPAPAVADDI